MFKISIPATPASALIYGDTTQGDGLVVSQIAPTQEALLNAVLGVLINDDPIKGAICGIVHVVEVDEFHHQIKLLAPGQLPSKNFLLGSLKMLK